MILTAGLLLMLAVALSAWLTGQARRYALARSLLDIPNARSSHKVPTPRGGGVAVVVTTLAGFVVLKLTGVMSLADLLALAGAGLGVAAVGLRDDHGHVGAGWRLIAHFAAAVWALAWIGGMAPVSLFGYTIDSPWIGTGVAAFYLVWVLNLCNFMDGIDGIAGVETVSVCVGASLMYFLAGYDDGVLTPLVLAAAAAGFLFWNFPPARIFMGDTGSGFIGIVLGVMSLQAAWIRPELFWGWVILLGVFVVDATVTLLWRLASGEPIHQPHRTHAYQRAAIRFGSHGAVTCAVAVVNVCWLIPIAAVVALGVVDGLFGVLIAYLPLLLLAFAFRSGVR